MKRSARDVKDVTTTLSPPSCRLFASMSPRRLFLAVPLIVAFCAALAACGGSKAASGFSAQGGDTSSGGGALFTPDAGDAGELALDDAAEGAPAVVATFQGSPLCNASTATSCCYPDSLSLCAPTACEAPSDAGLLDGPGGYAQVVFGCHLAPAPSASTDAAMASTPPVPLVAPACLPAGLGLSGAPCHAPADCAPGYECVGTDGTCRHYCCTGNSACKPDVQFCDIQQAVQVGQVGQASPMSVPVCMPIEPCALLQPGACPPGETCAVVREDGSKSCVAVGNASVGDSCETDHCKADLVCLGAPGKHHCYALCKMTQPGQCPPTQTCKGGLPLFLDPGFGVCE